MQSHLTRRVFRAIVNNEPLQSPRCRHGLPQTVPTYRVRRPGLSSFNHVQRRGLLSFDAAATTPGEQRASTLPSEMGLKTMRDLERSLADKSRGPTNGILAKAFQEFFAARAEAPGFITGFQAHLLRVTWNHLRTQEEKLEPEDWTAVFSVESLENLLLVLSEASCLRESRKPVLDISHSAFSELCADHGFGANEVSRPALTAYINLLALNGKPTDARQVVEKFWPKLRKVRPSPWLAVIKGFALQNKRGEMKWTAERLEKHPKRLDRETHEELMLLLIEQGLFNAAQVIYDRPLTSGHEPTLATKEAMIKYALFESEAAWAKSIFESIAPLPISQRMGPSLLWEAAHGKSALEISEQVKTWIAEDPEAEASLTISCLNDLIRLANVMCNPQLAGEYAALASAWDLQPDSETQALQLESYTLGGDVNRALELMQEVPTSLFFEHLPLVNRLITMLCWSGEEDALFNQVSGALGPLFEKNMHLEAKTIAALTRLLLYRNDWEAVSELLRPRLGSYESEDMVEIRTVLTDYILDKNQSTEDVWEAYNLLRLAFPETGVPMRSNIMMAFFDRQRSDLACLVFGHMRQAENRTQRPKPFTYARCFHGIARAGDAQNLELVHNMLKLDTHVDLGTQVRNGLMLAYACCEVPEKAMEIFREILKSEDGPTLRTIAIFYKACESHEDGVQEAVKMMKKSKVMELEVDRRMYTSYIVVFAAHCEFDIAVQALENMHAETGYEPTRNTYVLLYPYPFCFLQY